MKWLAEFGRFWYDFVVGDDWTIAVAVIVADRAHDRVGALAGRNAWPRPAGLRRGRASAASVVAGAAKA